MALVSAGKDRVRTDRLNTLEYELVQKIYNKNFAFTEKLNVLNVFDRWRRGRKTHLKQRTLVVLCAFMISWWDFTCTVCQ